MRMRGDIAIIIYIVYPRYAILHANICGIINQTNI
jgi:hypothetical protein